MAQITQDEAIARTEHARQKLRDISAFKPLETSRLLDVGCGTGNILIAAASMGMARPVGFDRNPREFGDPLLDGTCAHFGVAPGTVEIVEGSFEDVGADFDIVTCIDVIEHVEHPRRFIAQVADALWIGGVALIDTCPLYYSRQGHHLFSYFSPDDEPWPHLRPDFAAQCRERGVDDWSMERYLELNKVRHGEVLAAVADAGFVILKHHINFTDSDELARHRGDMVIPEGVSDIDLRADSVHLIALKVCGGQQDEERGRTHRPHFRDPGAGEPLVVADLGDLPERLTQLKAVGAPLFTARGWRPKSLVKKLINLPIRVVGRKQIYFNWQVLAALDDVVAQIRGQRGQGRDSSLGQQWIAAEQQRQKACIEQLQREVTDLTQVVRELRDASAKPDVQLPGLRDLDPERAAPSSSSPGPRYGKAL